MNTRTNIVLDDELVTLAMARAGVTTKKAAVEAALKAYVRKPDYAGLLALRGQGMIDPDYDPKGPYGLTDAALERRGLKTFQDARVGYAKQIDSATKQIDGARKPARKSPKPAVAPGRARRPHPAQGGV